MSANDRLPAFYIHGNTGNHLVVGIGTRVTYGHFGGGSLVPEGVFKKDVIARPDLWACANCRNPFQVMGGDVVCPQCSRAQIGGIMHGRPVEDAKIIAQPKAPPPPRAIVRQPDPSKKIEVARGVKTSAQPQIIEWETIDVLTTIPIETLVFGGYSHAKYVKLLNENGIVTLADVKGAGYDGMVKIKGIGPTVAKALLAYAKQPFELDA